MHDTDHIGSNPSDAPTLASIIETAATRRTVLQGGVAAVAATFLGGLAASAAASAAQARPPRVRPAAARADRSWGSRPWRPPPTTPSTSRPATSPTC